MRKIIFILIFMVVSLSVFAEITGEVSIGKDFDQENIYIANILLGYEMRVSEEFKLFPYFDYTNMFYKVGMSGRPFRDFFKVGFRLDLHDFFIESNHTCTHEVSALNDREGNSELYPGALPNSSETLVKIGIGF